ncbi:MAG: Fe-S cluster assembly protein SufD [Hyphomicrobiaceae bacterium]
MSEVTTDMTVVETRTAAELAIARNFEAVAARLPGDGDVRREAIARFGAVGLPHRRIEEWKYTDVRNALKVAFAPAERGGLSVAEAAVEQALGPFAALDAHRLVLVDGYFAPELSRLEGARGRVSVQARSEAIVVAQPRASRSAGSDGVLALNDAFVTDGAVVRIGASPEKPILLVFLARAAAPAMIATRNLVEVDAGVSAQVIEVHARLGAAALQSSAVTSVRLGREVALVHVKVLNEGSTATHLSQCNVEVGGSAAYNAFQLTAGAGLARNETHVDFTGPDAKIDISGAMLGRGADHIDTTLVINHSTLSCESREHFKAVLDDRARAVFQGKVIVEAEAQLTDGKQMAQALMLSPDCEFDSKPELEIYADDVACGHGSTVAEIDADMLFYLRSRGIPLEEARALIIESFVGEVIEKLDAGPVQEAVAELARGWLRQRQIEKRENGGTANG